MPSKLVLCVVYTNKKDSFKVYCRKKASNVDLMEPFSVFNNILAILPELLCEPVRHGVMSATNVVENLTS